MKIARINSELAALMGIAPADLASGADRSLSDPLVICGILGGKDVGKSTLINALAQQRVSADHEEVGLGTVRPMAYIHRDAVASYRRRFADLAELTDRLDVTEHDAEAIRSVVLVDLPDFDSDLPHHLETVQAIAPLLDRLMWIVTPRKIADRAWVSLFSSLVKDRRNVYCVLNKTDELLGDAVSEAGLRGTFLDEQVAWVCDLLAVAGCEHDRDHLFVVAAEAPTADAFLRHVARRWDDPDWSIYGAERDAVAGVGRRLADELARLRGCVLAPVARSDAASLKAANQRIEIRRNAETIRRHFELDAWLRRLERACDPAYHQALLNDAFGSEFCAIAGRRLRAGQRNETELADELLVERVEQWPILPIIFWPLRWLVRRVGARVAGTRWTATDAVPDVFSVHGQSLEERLQVYRARLDGDHARTVRRFQLTGRLPSAEQSAKRFASSAGSLVAGLDDELLVTLNQAYGRPGLWKRWPLWVILIWFPLVQPLSAGLLKLAGAGGEIDRLRGLLQIVLALGAGHLLTGLVFVGIVYFIILAAMYARCVAQVRRARRAVGSEADTREGLAIAERIDDLLVSEVVGGMSGPFVETHETLRELRGRLGQLC